MRVSGVLPRFFAVEAGVGAGVGAAEAPKGSKVSDGLAGGGAAGWEAVSRASKRSWVAEGARPWSAALMSAGPV